ncbi:TPA: hypothetical protein MYU21_005725, partial [Klebsiella pneumoniae]|nr:hypothetical protein [Escherichia coli]HBV3488053.1 hypothetical protein [Klebsiella pneumoniae]HCB3073633.1 hypothetical protein [Klebsiella pneumoniae]HCT3730597.1 hypothetical protein [Klebsiella pneumoniae]HCT8551233.1 hypothetical protein [Klebsiella pneumoniae]
FLFISLNVKAESLSGKLEYQNVSGMIYKKLSSCQDVAIDNYSYTDCKFTAEKDFDVYLGFLRSSIENNLKNSNPLLAKFDSDVKCDSLINDRLSNNIGSMWVGISADLCVVMKDNALKKWMLFYEAMKYSDQYNKKLDGIFDK